MGERRDAYRVLGGELRERDHLEDTSVDGRIILRRIFRNGMGRHELDLSGSCLGQGVGSFKCGNERFASIKCGEFLD